MLSRGTRAALSRRPGPWDAGLFNQFESENILQQRELEAASQDSQQEMLKRQDTKSLKLEEAGRFASDARISAPIPEVQHHSTLKNQRGTASGIQVNWPENLRGQHHSPASVQASEQNLWIVHPAIQAELAEFWAERAQARQEYRKSKALRETTAMAATSARSTKPAQRAAP
jgi:hypothetical protein